MKAILRAAVCAAALALTATAFASCGADKLPEENDPATTTQTTTTVAATTTTTKSGSLTASDVLVRSGPGLDYDVLEGIPYGAEFTILGREGDWYHIQYGELVGYINAQYVDVDDAPNASEMVEALKTTTTVTTTKLVTTQKPDDKTTSTKKGYTTATTTKAGATTTTKKGDTTTGTAVNGSTTAPTDGTGVVTTTSTRHTVRTTDHGIPEVNVNDDF